MHSENLLNLLYKQTNAYDVFIYTIIHKEVAIAHSVYRLWKLHSGHFYTHTYTHTYIYIYIYRERERERETSKIY